MAKKIITAKDILAQKGFVLNKFDQEGFNEKIVEFFYAHDVKDTILLVPKRLVEVEERLNPFCFESEEILSLLEKRKKRLEEDKKRGWVDMTDVKEWNRKIEDPSDPFDFQKYLTMLNKGLIRPTIYVDEPFIKNAAYMLSLIGGFVCKKQRGGKFVVSLI